MAVQPRLAAKTYPPERSCVAPGMEADTRAVLEALRRIAGAWGLTAGEAAGLIEVSLRTSALKKTPDWRGGPAFGGRAPVTAGATWRLLWDGTPRFTAEAA